MRQLRAEHPAISSRAGAASTSSRSSRSWSGRAQLGGACPVRVKRRPRCRPRPRPRGAHRRLRPRAPWPPAPPHRVPRLGRPGAARLGEHDRQVPTRKMQAVTSSLLQPTTARSASASSHAEPSARLGIDPYSRQRQAAEVPEQRGHEALVRHPGVAERGQDPGQGAGRERVPPHQARGRRRARSGRATTEKLNESSLTVRRPRMLIARARLVVVPPIPNTGELATRSIWEASAGSRLTTPAMSSRLARSSSASRSTSTATGARVGRSPNAAATSPGSSRPT